MLVLDHSLVHGQGWLELGESLPVKSWFMLTVIPEQEALLTCLPPWIWRKHFGTILSPIEALTLLFSRSLCLEADLGDGAIFCVSLEFQ